MMIRQYQIGTLQVTLEALAGSNWICHVEGYTEWTCEHGHKQRVPVESHKQILHRKMPGVTLRIIESAIRGDESSAAWLANNAVSQTLMGNNEDRCAFVGVTAP